MAFVKKLFFTLLIVFVIGSLIVGPSTMFQIAFVFGLLAAAFTLIIGPWIALALFIFKRFLNRPKL